MADSINSYWKSLINEFPQVDHRHPQCSCASPTPPQPHYPVARFLCIFSAAAQVGFGRWLVSQEERWKNLVCSRLKRKFCHKKKQEVLSTFIFTWFEKVSGSLAGLAEGLSSPKAVNED